MDEKFPENPDMINETDSNELWKREFQFDNKMEIFITRISSYKIATDINSFKLGRKSFLKLKLCKRIHFERVDKIDDLPMSNGLNGFFIPPTNLFY